MAIPFLIVLSKLSSSLMIFSIRYLLSVWYRIASLAAVFASYPAQIHLSACSLTLTYHSRKQRYLYGIFWNSWNLAIAWFVCCHMLLVTFVSAYTHNQTNMIKETLHVVSDNKPLHSFGFFGSTASNVVHFICLICTCCHKNVKKVSNRFFKILM